MSKHELGEVLPTLNFHVNKKGVSGGRNSRNEPEKAGACGMRTENGEVGRQMRRRKATRVYLEAGTGIHQVSSARLALFREIANVVFKNCIHLCSL